MPGCMTRAVMIMWPFDRNNPEQSVWYTEHSKFIASLKQSVAELITRMEQMETRMNSLRGLVNKKLAVPESEPGQEPVKEEKSLSKSGLIRVDGNKPGNFRVKG